MSNTSPEIPLESLRTYARVAGILYLVIIVCAGFSQGYVRASLVVPGDGSATAQNIMASESLFRLGFAGDLVAFLSDVGVSILLYFLLRPVSKTLSLLAAAFRLLAHPAIASVNLLNHFAAVLLLSGADYLRAFDVDQLHALVMLTLETHRYGYLIGGAFFGVHCAILGYLLFRSPLFPRALGVLMAAAAIGYLMESAAFFLAPALESAASGVVVVTAGLAEVALCLWLLLRGVQDPRGGVPIPAGADA